MPARDGTGPLGAGPMTGRGMGFCVSYASPNQVLSRGYFARGRGNFGRGASRGFRNRYSATGLTGWQQASMGIPAFAGPYPSAPEMTAKQEMDILKDEAESLKKELLDIQNRIETLEKTQEEKA